MELNYGKTIKVVRKQSLGLRSLLNIIGVFIFIGSILTMITMPYGLDSNLRIHQIEKIKLTPKEIKEFLLFIGGVSLLYFYLTNIYFLGSIGKKIFFISLTILALIDIYIIYRLI